MSHSGQYHRVHPSGNYVLYSHGTVSIADLTDHSAPKVIESKMKNETYPVEGANGGWDLLASPYDSGGMNYYQFKDVVAKQQQADSVYKDKENDEYYHSSAELPGSTANEKKVRTLLFGQKYREYTMTKDAQGNFTNVVPGPANQQMCKTFVDNSPAPPLDRSMSAQDQARLTEAQGKIAELDMKINQIEAKQAPLYIKLDRLSRKDKGARKKLLAEIEKINQEQYKIQDQRRPYSQVVQELRYGSHYAELYRRSRKLQNDYFNLGSAANEEQRRESLRTQMSAVQTEMSRYSEGERRRFANPVLSKDGTLVAAAGSNTVNVFRILADGACEKVAETGFQGSKVSFSYPVPGRLPKIAFTADAGPSGGNGSGVYQYDLETKQTTYLGVRGEYARYPGYTKDGRVIYAGGPSGASGGFTIVDPNQVNGTNSSTCIQKPAAASGGVEESAPAPSGSAE